MSGLYQPELQNIIGRDRGEFWMTKRRRKTVREIEWIPVYREMPPSGEPVYFCVIPLFHLGFASMRPPQIKFGYYESDGDA